MNDFYVKDVKTLIYECLNMITHLQMSLTLSLGKDKVHINKPDCPHSVLCERFNYKALQGKYTQVNTSTLEAPQN